MLGNLISSEVKTQKLSELSLLCLLVQLCESLYMNTGHSFKQLAGLVLLLFTLPVVGSCRSTPEAKADQPPAIAVKLTTVQAGRLTDSSEYIATLESRQSVTLQPRVEGQVSQILVRAGDQVAAGTTLIQIDPARQQASVSSYAAATESAQATLLSTRADAERARASLANAQAELANLQAERQAKLSDLKLSRLQFDRYRALQAQGAVSQQVLDEYTNSLDAADSSLRAMDEHIRAQQAAVRAQQADVASRQAEVVKAAKGIQQANASTQEQQEQLNYFRIAAPFAGQIGDIPVKVGDFVNTSTRLTTVTQNNPLIVNISIPIERAMQLQPGMTVEVLNADGKKLGDSQIFFIAPNTHNGTQSVLVKAQFNNDRGQLRADQFIRARVIWNQRPGVSIPTTAISRTAGQEFVFVAEQGKSGLVVKQRPVKLGSIEGNNYQVLEGLKAGDRVAVSGLLRLSDGAAIVPETPNNSAPPHPSQNTQS
jgi:RND family efflux transporter MFP subunit